MPSTPLLSSSSQAQPRPLPPPVPLHRRLSSSPSTSKAHNNHPRTRTPSPSYGATSGWDELGERFSPKSSKKQRGKKTSLVFLLALLGLLVLSRSVFFSSKDGQESAFERWWRGEGSKQVFKSPFPSPHSHFLTLSTLPESKTLLSTTQPSHRLIIVGDIHGSIAPLQALLKKLKYDGKRDVLLHVGDTIAKGPDPLEVLRLLRREGVMGVRGNHDQPVIEWRSWMNKVLGEKSWPFPELDDWTESYARKKAGYLPMDGEKFKWQGEHFKIARMMSKEDYQYLLSLPLVLHLPSLSTHLVHAGLLPLDPTLPPSAPPPAWQLPNPTLNPNTLPPHHPHFLSSQTQTLLNQTSRELLLLTSIPQNTVPWNILNMRSIDEEGGVSKETLEGGGWSEVWNEVMEECRVRGGSGKSSSVEGEEEEEGEEGEGKVGIEKKKNKKGGKKKKGKKQEISCEPISIIYGHAAGRGLDLKPHSFGLDSGCVYGRRLSALVLGDLTSLDDPEEMRSWKEKGDWVGVRVGRNEGRVVGLDCEVGELE